LSQTAFNFSIPAIASLTWNFLSNAVPYELFDIHFVNAVTGFLVGAGGHILRSDDGGITWAIIPAGTPNDLHEICFADASTVYIAGSNGTILKSADGGLSWTLLNSGTTSNLYAVYFTDAEHGYAAGNGGIILHTNDGGATWEKQDSQTGEMIRDICFPGATTGFAAGYDAVNYRLPGVVLKTTNGGYASVPPPVSPETETPSVFPNPAEGSFFVSLFSFRKTAVRIELINIRGQNVSNLAETEVATGTSRIGIQRPPVPDGFYILKITTGSKIYMKKIIFE